MKKHLLALTGLAAAIIFAGASPASAQLLSANIGGVGASIDGNTGVYSTPAYDYSAYQTQASAYNYNYPTQNYYQQQYQQPSTYADPVTKTTQKTTTYQRQSHSNPSSNYYYQQQQYATPTNAGYYQQGYTYPANYAYPANYSYSAPAYGTNNYGSTGMSLNLGL